MSEREEIEILITWYRERQPAASVRCPICHDFPSAGTDRYTRFDGWVWLCADCWERVFGDGDE